MSGSFSGFGRGFFIRFCAVFVGFGWCQVFLEKKMVEETVEQFSNELKLSTYFFLCTNQALWVLYTQEQQREMGRGWDVLPCCSPSALASNLCFPENVHVFQFLTSEPGS